MRVFLPIVPEAVIAMPACARIGATHSVVFGGLSADALGERIRASALPGGGAVSGLLGILDDLRGAGAWNRFAAGFAAAAAPCALGFRIEEIVIPFGRPAWPATV